MKNVFKAVLLISFIFLTASVVNAQTKIGFVNLNAVMDQMPEVKPLSAQLQTYQKQFIDQLTTMNNEYTTKVKAYQAQTASMNDAARMANVTELQSLEKRLQDYQTYAQQQVDAKKNELIKPVFDKVHEAVVQVAKEKGYNYVFDTSIKTIFALSPDADDLLVPVKAKLGLK